MSTCSIGHTSSGIIVRIVAVVVIVLTAAACGKSGPTATPLPATATRITLEATDTPLPPTAAPTLAPTTAPPPTAAVSLLREWVNLGADQGPIYDQSWSSDGRLFATADYDQVRVWEINARREAGLLRGHTDFVTGLAWSPNANVLASASQDGTVRLWDGTALTQTAILEIGQALGCLTWSPDGRQLAVGSNTGDVHLWDVVTQEMPKTWSTHTADNDRDDIISIAWSPDGQTIASGDLEGNIYLWNVATGQARMVLTEQTSGHARDVNGLSWSPDGSMLASAHPDGQIQLWDSATGQMLRAIAAHTTPTSDVACASDVAWSPSGEFLASIGHKDRRIRLWDPETGRLYAEARHASLPGWSISWSPDGSKVASGCGKWQQPHVGEIIVWTVPFSPTTALPADALVPPTTTVPPTSTPEPTPTPLAPLDGRGGGVIAFNSERGGSLEIYVMNADGSDQRRLTSNGKNNGWPTWSPDGMRIAYHSVQSGSAINYLDIYNGLSGQWKVLLDGNLWEPAWSHSGQWIAFSNQMTGSNGDIYVINSEGEQLTRLTDADGFDGGPFWSPDDRQIAFYSNRDGNFEVYVMLADGAGQRRLTDNPAEDLVTTWSPDGARLAFFSDRDGDYDLYTINADGSDLVQLTNNPADEQYPAWSPDGTQMAFISDRDGNFEVYVAPVPAPGALIDDNSVRRLTDSPGRELMPAWRPAPVPPTAEPLPTATPPAAAEAAGDTWWRTYRHSGSEVVHDVLMADDGGYYIVGTNDLEFEPEQRGDVYLIKTDAAGEILWEKTFGGEKLEEGNTIFPTSDGQLMIVGYTSSFGADGIDTYIIKLDRDGNELWSKTLNGPLDEMGGGRQMDDGGFILGGNSVDPNDIVADPGAAGYAGYAGRSNVFITRTDGDGNALWTHIFGGERNVLMMAGDRSPDGGFVILATIMYYPKPDDDIYLLKVDENGQEVWSRTWEKEAASGYALIQTSDGGYLFTGPYRPEGSEKEDFLFIKTDAAGNEVWRTTSGDPDMIDYGVVLVQAADGGYVAAGEWVKDYYSHDSDISLVKIDAQGQLVWQQKIETNAHNMLARILQHPDGGYVIASSTLSGNTFDIMLIKTDSEGRVRK